MEPTAATSRTGAELLIATAEANGITACFANPGTTELHLVEALDRSRIRTVLCLFEGVCSGAADGHARMTGVPAIGLFHLGPGYANSLANQHNARRHQTPVVNVIGDQASWHLAVDAPLTSDIDALSEWAGTTYRVASADDSAEVMARAIATIAGGPNRIANVVVPADSAWTRTAATPVATSTVSVDSLDDAELDVDLDRAAALLGSPDAILIAGGRELRADAVEALERIRLATGCRVAVTRAAKAAVGRHLPSFDELPYFPQPLHKTLAGTGAAVVVGRPAPVTFFGYPDTTSDPLPATAERMVIDDHRLDPSAVLVAVADHLGAPPLPAPSTQPLGPVEPGPLTVAGLGHTFAAAIPEGSIVVNESITSGAAFRQFGHQAEPHTQLSVLGGAIGGGLPTALGAAVACPDRPVLALQADGSALYTIQSLWSMAREQLDVTVVVCANRSYRILEIEVASAGLELGPAGASLVDLADPSVSFPELAAGFGVPGRSATTTTELEEALRWAGREPGPHLIEAVLT